MWPFKRKKNVVCQIPTGFFNLNVYLNNLLLNASKQLPESEMIKLRQQAERAKYGITQ